jgi:hypothetical protein
VNWRVDRVTHTRNGADVDDGPIYVSLLMRGAQTATIGIGDGVGGCSTNPSSHAAAACTESLSGTLVTRLVCGGDAHVDRVVCFGAIRAGNRIYVSRHEYDVPVADGNDGEPRPAKLVLQSFSDSVDVADAVVRLAATEYRDVARK